MEKKLDLAEGSKAKRGVVERWYTFYGDLLACWNMDSRAKGRRSTDEWMMPKCEHTPYNSVSTFPNNIERLVVSTSDKIVEAVVWHVLVLFFKNTVGKKRGGNRTRCLQLGTDKMNTFCNAQSDRDDITFFRSKRKTSSNVYGICEALGLGIEILTIFNANVVGS